MSDAVITKPVVTDDERIRMVGQGIHSWAMEGLELDPQAEADALEFALGNVTAEEVIQRTRARFGLK